MSWMSPSLDATASLPPAGCSCRNTAAAGGAETRDRRQEGAERGGTFWHATVAPGCTLMHYGGPALGCPSVAYHTKCIVRPLYSTILYCTTVLCCDEGDRGQVSSEWYGHSLVSAICSMHREGRPTVRGARPHGQERNERCRAGSTAGTPRRNGWGLR